MYSVIIKSLSTALVSSRIFEKNPNFVCSTLCQANFSFVDFLYNFVINCAFRIYEKVFVRIICEDRNGREKGGRPQAESGRKIKVESWVRIDGGGMNGREKGSGMMVMRTTGG